MSERRRLGRQELEAPPRREDVELLDGFVTLQWPNVEAIYAIQRLTLAGDEFGATIALIMGCVVNEDGTPVYSDPRDVKKINPQTFGELGKACAKFIKPDFDGIAKNSPASQSTDLASA